MSALLEEAHEPPLPTLQPVGPPFETHRVRRVVAGGEIELVLQQFDDRIMVIVTDNDKMGCLSQATLPAVHPLLAPPSAPADTPLSALPPPPPSISIVPLAGSPPDQALHDLYVGEIATLVWWALQLENAPRRPVVVGLSLKKRSEGMEAERERFKGVMDMLAGLAWFK